MRYSKEEIAEANSMSIVDYFRSRGYDCEKKGREWRIHGFDAMSVNPDTNYFYRHSFSGSSDQKGGYGLVTCLQKVLGYTFLDAMKEAYGEPRGQEYVPKPVNKTTYSPPKEKIDVVLPKAAENCKRVYAYLINTRKIPAEVINEFVKNKLLYQEKEHGNAVFVQRDKSGKVLGAELQGTCTDHRFKGILPGTSGTVTYTKGEPNRVILFESSIDILSFIALHPEVNNAVFTSMGGLKPNIAEEHINEVFPSPDKIKVVSCVDTDEAGVKFNKNFMLRLTALRNNLEMDVISSDEFIYGKSTVNGTEYRFFPSTNDAREYQNSNLVPPNVKIVAPSSTMEFFKASYECEHNDVKDFNDLLKKRMGVPVPSLAETLAAAAEKKAKEQSENKYVR